MLLRTTVIVTLALGPALAACGGQDAPKPSTTQEPQATQAPKAQVLGLQRISDPSQVCMVNNQFMGKAQIPVEVGGKTYFGCCAMCKDRLSNDPEVRTAVDPVSGEKVDKASAVLAKNEEGVVYYFANEMNLHNFGVKP